MDTKVETIILVSMLSFSTSWAQESKSANSTADDVELVDTTSSRSIIGEQKKMDWVDSIQKRMTISKRLTGPFGMLQDPNAAVVKIRKKKVEKGAFLEAVGAIVINTIIPSDRTFISNSREFSVGDQFPIIKNQRQFDIEVVSVSSRGIIFENTATGERVRKKLNALPPGMKKSSSLGSIPGVYAANRKNIRPLNLDDESLSQINK